MRILATTYFYIWALISCIFLSQGFRILDYQQKHEIHPLSMFILKLFFAVCVSHSSFYAVVCRHGAVHPTIRIRHTEKLISFAYVYPLVFNVDEYSDLRWPIVRGIVIIILILIHIFISQTGDLILVVNLSVRQIFLSAAKRYTDGVPWLMRIPLLCTAVLAGEPKLIEWVTKSKVLEMYKTSKTAKFAVAMFGSIFFQNYAKFTTLGHVLAFLCISVAWLGCIAMVMASEDGGVFEFLLSNVIIGCTVNLFRLHSQTWLVYVASALLFGMRQGLESVQLTQEGTEVLIRDGTTVLWLL